MSWVHPKSQPAPLSPWTAPYPVPPLAPPHRGVPCGAVGTVHVGVLQGQRFLGCPRGIKPMQGVGVSPEELGWVVSSLLGYAQGPRPAPLHSRVWELQAHIVRVGPHMVELVPRELLTDVVGQGCHPCRAGYPGMQAGLPGMWGTSLWGTLLTYADPAQTLLTKQHSPPPKCPNPLRLTRVPPLQSVFSWDLLSSQ